jgi:serine/threonine protein kinase/tetratricopeptide (TPR) repeat protein
VRGDQLIGTRIGNFLLTGVLSEGETGVLFRAEHPELGRRAAIKVLDAQQSALSEIKTRFLDEARLLAQIQHPNVISVFDFGKTIRHELYYVMELLQGTTLDRVMERHRPMTPEQLWPYLEQICDGLEAAHAQGIVHRALKPSNVFVLEGKRSPIKLVGFGIAMDAPGSGKPLTISPEQAAGHTDEIGLWTDLYSLGVLIYWALAGRPPFDDPIPSVLLSKHATEEAPRLVGRPPVPAAISELVRRCLAKLPEDRPSSAAEIAETFQSALGLTAGTEPTTAPFRLSPTMPQPKSSLREEDETPIRLVPLPPMVPAMVAPATAEARAVAPEEICAPDERAIPASSEEPRSSAPVARQSEPNLLSALAGVKVSEDAEEPAADEPADHEESEPERAPDFVDGEESEPERAPDFVDGEESEPERTPDFVDGEESEPERTPDFVDGEESEPERAPDFVDHEESEPERAPDFVDREESAIEAAEPPPVEAVRERRASQAVPPLEAVRERRASQAVPPLEVVRERRASQAVPPLEAVRERRASREVVPPVADIADEPSSVDEPSAVEPDLEPPRRDEPSSVDESAAEAAAVAATPVEELEAIAPVRKIARWVRPVIAAGVVVAIAGVLLVVFVALRPGKEAPSRSPRKSLEIASLRSSVELREALVTALGLKSDAPLAGKIRALSSADEGAARELADAAKGSPSGQLLLGQLLLAVGAPQPALEVARAALKHESSPQAQVLLGEATCATGDPEAAIPYYEKAIAAAPTDGRAHLRLGEARQLLGNLDQALSTYQQALQRDPKVAAPARTLTGDVFALKGQVHNALAEYRAAITADARYAPAHLALGRAEARRGFYDDALPALELAVKADPELARAWQNRGAILLNVGRKDDAIASYRRAITLRPNLLEARYQLGEAYVVLGQTAPAREQFEAVLAIDPEHAQAVIALEKLRQGK